MKIYTILIFLSLMLIASISLVIAVSDNGNGQQVQARNETGPMHDEVVAVMNKTNMTYGQCVSAGAEIKNTCYEQVKQTSTTCDSTAAKDKAMKKECNSAYKTQKNACKDSFKQYKTSCKQIKHNFLETIRYSFA